MASKWASVFVKNLREQNAIPANDDELAVMVDEAAKGKLLHVVVRAKQLLNWLDLMPDAETLLTDEVRMAIGDLAMAVGLSGADRESDSEL